MADDSYEFDALPAERQKLLLDWILHNLKPIKSINPKSGSGTLKHLVQLAPGQNSYFTNGAFKGAMLKAGYRTENREAVNWTFSAFSCHSGNKASKVMCRTSQSS